MELFNITYVWKDVQSESPEQRAVVKHLLVWYETQRERNGFGSGGETEPNIQHNKKHPENELVRLFVPK